MATATTPMIELNNGVELPALGLGVFQSPPDETLTAVEAAIEYGYRLVDTAAALHLSTVDPRTADRLADLPLIAR